MLCQHSRHPKSHWIDINTANSEGSFVKEFIGALFRYDSLMTVNLNPNDVDVNAEVEKRMKYHTSYPDGFIDGQAF
jgi:hypothetical protein